MQLTSATQHPTYRISVSQSTTVDPSSSSSLTNRWAHIPYFSSFFPLLKESALKIVKNMVVQVVSEPKRVLLDHDGAVDDLVALALLAVRIDIVDIIGCVVTDADCFIEEGFQVSGKLLSMLKSNAPVGRSSLQGKHPFPDAWRRDSIHMNDFPSLNTKETLAHWEANRRHAVDVSGEQLMADLVMQSPQPITLCVTGPLSNVAWCVAKYGDAFTKNVESVVIMGGAVDVKGNVHLPTTDGSAEWNIYWDAPSADVVFRCANLKKILFSLDSTNSVPVTSSFVQRFGAQNDFLLSQFVGSAWAMCTQSASTGAYFAWDALTASYILTASIVGCLVPRKLVVVTGDVPSEGRTMESVEKGAVVYVAGNVDVNSFYSLMLFCCRFMV